MQHGHVVYQTGEQFIEGRRTDACGDAERQHTYRVQALALRRCAPQGQHPYRVLIKPRHLGEPQWQRMRNASGDKP